MMGSKIAVLFGCLVSVAGRSLTVEKTVMLAEDSKDTDAAINYFLRTVLRFHDVTSGEQDDPCLCSKGICRCCQKISIYEACIIATRGNNVIKMNITIDKEEYMEARVPFPLTLCSAGTGMKAKNCCLEVTKMNRTEASACAFVSFEVDTKWYTGKTECFKIPASGIAVDEAVDNKDEAVDYKDEAVDYKDEAVDNKDEAAVDYMESPNDAGKVFRLGPILKFLTFSSNAKQTRLK